jgi:hypothetical protein
MGETIVDNKRYLRREDESEYEYGLRLIEIKMSEKPDDLEWEDMIESLNLQVHRDTLRKSVQGKFGGYDIYKYLKEKLNNNITDEEILDELEIKKIEIQKEKIKLSSLKTEYNKWMRQDARLELFFDEMKKSIKTIEVPDFKPIFIDKDKKGKIGLLGISDIHFGKLFTSINNKYSEDIFIERMNKLISETIELCKEQNISHLHVLNCGDDIEGMTLRISQLASLQHGMTDQVIKLARFMAKFLNKLSEHITITYHHVLSGNHSEIRAFNDKTFTYENMERIIISYIHDVLENNPRITVPEYNGKYLDFKIFNYNIYAQHGQKVKNPKNVIADASQQHRKFYDIAYFGHIHHEMTITTNEAKNNDCEVIYIPSIMGSDEYCDDNYFGGAKASAKFDVYEEDVCRKASFKIILN